MKEYEQRMKDYKPDVNIEYTDEFGKVMTPKEVIMLNLDARTKEMFLKKNHSSKPPLLSPYRRTGYFLINSMVKPLARPKRRNAYEKCKKSLPSTAWAVATLHIIWLLP